MENLNNFAENDWNTFKLWVKNPSILYQFKGDIQAARIYFYECILGKKCPIKSGVEKELSVIETGQEN